MMRRAFLVALVGCMGGGAVAGVLTARHEHAQAAGERMASLGRIAALIPQYPDAPFFAMGEALHVNGVEREMAYATTKDSPAKVAERYEGIWNSQGFEVERMTTDSEEWLTARAENDPFVRTVVVSRTGGRTAIVASLRSADAEGSEARIPVPSICDVVGHHGAKDQGVGTEVVLMTCHGYVREVVDYYDHALQGTDSKDRLGDALARGHAYISYSGVDIEALLSASQSESDPPHTAVTITWQERR